MMIKRIRIVVGAVLAASLGTAAYAHNTAQETANKKLVADFYAELEKPDQAKRIAGIAERFIAPDYIQHQEGAKDGREALVKDFQNRPAAGSAGRPAMAPAKLIALMAEGDKVIQVTSRDVPDPATGGTKLAIIWNMFRIKNGQLAEHWDVVPTSIRPPSAAK
jgi:predicted SnoaL-like aldol condensation-catalyzing enzyme